MRTENGKIKLKGSLFTLAEGLKHECDKINITVMEHFHGFRLHVQFVCSSCSVSLILVLCK